MDGLINYKELPKGYLPAIENDFFMSIGVPKRGMEFIMQSFHTQIFQVFIVNENFKLDSIKPWMDKDRCWVKKEKAVPKTKEDTASDNILKDISWGF